VFLHVPALARSVGAFTLTNFPAEFFQGLLGRLYPELGGKFSPGRMEAIAGFLRNGSEHEAYKGLMSYFQDPRSVAPAMVETPSRLDDLDLRRAVGDVMPWAAFIDTLTYLPDDILVKVDRASMAAGLETRVPLLDPEVISFAAGVDWALKTRGGVGKWPLKELLARYVPRSLFERPKRGFGVPLGDWLRDDLRPWAESLLAPDVGLMPEILDPHAVARLWREHLAGTQDHKTRIWALLMLQQWAVDHGLRG